MMDEHLRNISMRDKLRLLIIPLLQKCMDEDPQDIIVFCSRYFQALLDDRNNSELKENEERILSDEQLKARCEGSMEKKPALQGSTSLPILIDDVSSSKGLQLRETSSWDEGSSFRRTPSSHPKKVQFSVADPVIQIGDQLSVADGCTDVEEKDDKNIGEGCKSEVVVFSNLDVAKHEGNNLFENKKTSTEISYACLCPLSNNTCTLVPSVDEFQVEFDELVQAALSSVPQTPASTRKKWKIEADAHWQLDRKLELTRSSNVDSDDAAHSHTFKAESNEAIASSKNESGENESLNESFGFIPKFEIDIDTLVIPRSLETGTSNVEDIESLVKSVSRALQELVHVLCASRLYFDDKLEKIKQIKCVPVVSKVVEGTYTPPRKKRSVTTFPVSDVGPQNRNNARRFIQKEQNDVSNSVDGIHSFEKNICIKAEKRSKSTEHSEDKSVTSKKVEGFPEQKESSDANEKATGSSEVINENIAKYGKGIRRAKNPAKKNDEAPREARPQIEKFESKEALHGNRTEDHKSESHTNDISDNKDGIKSELELPDENLSYKSWRKNNRKPNNNYYDSRSNPPFENRQHPRQTRCPNEYKPFNMPHGTSTRSQGGRGFNNRPPRHMFRGGQISSRQRLGSSSFLEGGDVLHATLNTQRSIGTETDFSHARGRPRNSNVRAKLETNNASSSKGNFGSCNIDGHCTKVPEKDSVGNETSKNNILSSVNGIVGGSVTPHKEPKDPKPIDKSSKPIDRYSKPTYRSPKPIDRSTEKSEPKLDRPLQNPLKHAQRTGIDDTEKNAQQDGKSGINLSRPTNSSSLNPGAKSFSPTNFMRTKRSLVKSPDNQTTSRRGREILETTDAYLQSKDSELSGRRNYGFTTDWTIESSESDVTSEENEIANNSNAPNLENGRSDVNENRRGFNSRTNESDKETDIPNPLMNGLENRSAKDNVFQGRMNGAFRNDEKTLKEKNDNKKPCSYSDLKMDEASLGGNEEPEHENASSKQELGLNSACGDFVVIEDGGIDQPPSEPQEGVIPRLNADIQVRRARSMDGQAESVSGSIPQDSVLSVPKEEPGLNSACGDFVVNENGIVQPPPPVGQEDISVGLNVSNQVPFLNSMDDQNRDVSRSTHENRNRNEDMETELNFTCFSDGETSELDSDLSEEYSYEEKAEQDR